MTHQQISFMMFLIVLIVEVFFVFLGIYIGIKKRFVLKRFLKLLFKKRSIIIKETTPTEHKERMEQLFVMLVSIAAIMSLLFLISRGKNIIDTIIRYKYLLLK